MIGVVGRFYLRASEWCLDLLWEGNVVFIYRRDGFEFDEFKGTNFVLNCIEKWHKMVKTLNKRYIDAMQTFPLLPHQRKFTSHLNTI